MLCLVTGVSGSGKSSLVEDDAFSVPLPAIEKERLPLEFNDVFGDGQIDDVIMVDQSPIGRSPCSNPVTYQGVRRDPQCLCRDGGGIDARIHREPFQLQRGRRPWCSECWDGYLRIDMQFLADVYMKCSQCGGTRYRDEILDVTYRGRNIAEVLEMTVREAYHLLPRGSPRCKPGRSDWWTG